MAYRNFADRSKVESANVLLLLLNSIAQSGAANLLAIDFALHNPQSLASS